MTSLVSVDLPDTEDPKNVVRVGWSTDSASLQLGELHVIKHQMCCSVKGTLPIAIQFLLPYFYIS